jgi:putative FmdB family regulatory protein
MPIYEYQCVDCSGRDQRVAGLDDHTALCAQCGGLMLRLDEDVFQPYFEEAASQIWAKTDSKTKASL